MVIFDEAHALEDVATEFFGLTASSGRLATLATDVLTHTPRTSEHHATLTAMALELRTRSERFFTSVSEVLFPRRCQARLPARAGHRWTCGCSPRRSRRRRPQAALLLETLSGISALCPEEDADLGAFHRRAVEAAFALDTTLRADDPSQVYWASTRGRTLSLRAAPIDVGQSLSTSSTTRWTASSSPRPR